ncbi:MAG: hypothetical protein L0191_12080, partial [Acidobacteria bacterium]|nr:hypothetical protein [Acidobacteriota bacterium]
MITGGADLHLHSRHSDGADVLYLADAPVLPLLEACLKVLREPLDLAVLPPDAAAAVAAARRVVRTFGPTH